MLAQRPVESAHERLIGAIRGTSRRGKQNCPGSLHFYAPWELSGQAQRAAGDG